MPSIAETIERLKSAHAQAGSARQPVASRLSSLKGFGSNPGALEAYSYVPAALSPAAPLVVVLHGCTQTAAGYDHGAGWSKLADRHGFALLYPEQQRANNPNLCFNWFLPEDIRRDSGEALSIAQMVRQMLASHGLDRRRVFITGLSAGGAMTSVMLATYPELFASGAIIAGLPFGVARSVPEALDRMRGRGLPGPAQLEALVRGASRHDGPWPTLSLWHGGADHTVASANADAVLAQWRGLHGLGQVEPTRSAIGPHSRQLWLDGAGRPTIEAYSLSGMGHGTPLGSADDIGQPGPYMLDAGISSTRHIARFWQLTPTGAQMAVSGREQEAPRQPEATGTPRAARAARPAALGSGVGKVIEDALRAAGLMR